MNRWNRGVAYWVCHVRCEDIKHPTAPCDVRSRNRWRHRTGEGFQTGDRIRDSLEGHQPSSKVQFQNFLYTIQMFSKNISKPYRGKQDSSKTTADATFASFGNGERGWRKMAIQKRNLWTIPPTLRTGTDCFIVKSPTGQKMENPRDRRERKKRKKPERSKQQTDRSTGGSRAVQHSRFLSLFRTWTHDASKLYIHINI